MLAWSDNWADVAMNAISVAGFDRVSELCARYPGLTYVQLSKTAIGGAVAPAQIRILQMKEAILTGQLHQALRDCFVRTFNEYARHGWAEGFRWDYNAASIVASMQTTLTAESIGGDSVEKIPLVWAALTKLSPPKGNGV